MSHSLYLSIWRVKKCLRFNSLSQICLKIRILVESLLAWLEKLFSLSHTYERPNLYERQIILYFCKISSIYYLRVTSYGLSKSNLLIKAKKIFKCFCALKKKKIHWSDLISNWFLYFPPAIYVIFSNFTGINTIWSLEDIIRYKWWHQI